MPRDARQTRPQVVCILADNSGSMAGEKAEAATRGIQEMIMECQSKGPPGPDRSYYKLLLIQFSDNAEILCDMTPVRKIDPESIRIEGNGGETNITAALELAYQRLSQYMQSLQTHPERSQHPLPLVLLFSDGAHNTGPRPEPVANQLKMLNLDGEPIVIAAAGVSSLLSLDSAPGLASPPAPDNELDEATLRAIASPDCYIHITNVQVLTKFLATVGSSGMSRAKDIAALMRRLGN